MSDLEKSPQDKTEGGEKGAEGSEKELFDDQPDPEGEEGSKKDSKEEGSKAEDEKEPEKDSKKSDKKEEPKKTEKSSEESKGEKEFELKLPKDSLLDAEAVKSVADFAKAKKLTQEQAQAILDSQSAQVAGYVEKQQKEIEEAPKRWAKEAQEDKEIGGDKFKEHVELSSRFVEKFGSDSIRKFLDDSGLGNNKEVIKLFSKAQREFEDDRFEHGPQRGAGGGKRRPDAEILYDKTSGVK